MKKTRLLFLIVILVNLISCEGTHIANNIRVLVKGRVVDQNNTPIPEAKIRVYTDANSYGSAEYLLAEGYSDSDGIFEVTSLFGSNQSFDISVVAEDDYATYTYRTNTSDFTPNNLVFNLQTVELKQIAVFNYTITRTSGEDNTLNFSFKYIYPYCNETYEEAVLNEFESSCYLEGTQTRLLNNNIPNLENRTLYVPIDTTIEFTYRVNDGEEFSEIITINQTTTEFEFTY